MRRYAARADGNQGEIITSLRAAQCNVTPTHVIGGGFPDLVVQDRVTLVVCLIEIKDPSKPKADRQLTPAQKEFHAAWTGPIYVCETPEDAVACATKDRVKPA